MRSNNTSHVASKLNAHRDASETSSVLSEPPEEEDRKPTPPIKAGSVNPEITISAPQEEPDRRSTSGSSVLSPLLAKCPDIISVGCCVLAGTKTPSNAASTPLPSLSHKEREALYVQGDVSLLGLSCCLRRHSLNSLVTSR